METAWGAVAAVENRAPRRRRVWAVSLGVVLLTLVLPQASHAACPNEAIRAEQGTTGLPACMGLELISPGKFSAIKKLGQAAFGPHISPDGSRALFYSTAGLAETPGLQNPFGDRYLATRGASGWTVAPTSPPTEAAIATGGDPLGGPFAFAPDFTRWMGLGGTQTQVNAGVFQVYTYGLTVPFEPLSPVLVPLDDSGEPGLGFTAVNPLHMGASPDLSTSVVGMKRSSTGLLPEDPRGEKGLTASEPGGDTNAYAMFRDESGLPSVALLTRDEANTGKVYGGRCGSHLGGGLAGQSSGGAGSLNQGALSQDGSRIYFSTRPDQPESIAMAGPPCDTDNPLRIMTFTKTPAGPAVDLLFEGGATEGDDLYQGASADGGEVFFVTTRSLAPTDTDLPAPGASCGRDLGASASCDLYLYDADLPEGERLIQVSAGGTGDPDPGKGANVLSSIPALSTDGSHAYFVAQGVLTTDPNPEGATAVAGKPNLYLYERNAANPDGRTAFVGTLSAGDKSSLWGVNQSHLGGAYAVPMLGGAEGGDGHVLLLASKAPLTGDDPDGSFRDVFRYDAEAETLQLLSAPSEEVLPFDVSVNSNFKAPAPPNFATEGRWASEDGFTVGFSTSEQLVASDGDNAPDPYLWKEGKVTRLEGDGRNPVVSPSGDLFGFSGDEALVPQDGDTATDVYVARVDGGFAPPPPRPTCHPLQESCQGPATVPPDLGAAFQGPGNPKAASKPKCPKGKVRRGGRCVKPKAKKKAGNKQKGGRR